MEGILATLMFLIIRQCLKNNYNYITLNYNNLGINTF